MWPEAGSGSRFIPVQPSRPDSGHTSINNQHQATLELREAQHRDDSASSRQALFGIPTGSHWVVVGTKRCMRARVSPAQPTAPTARRRINHMRHLPAPQRLVALTPPQIQCLGASLRLHSCIWPALSMLGLDVGQCISNRQKSAPHRCRDQLERRVSIKRLNPPYFAYHHYHERAPSE